MGLGPAGREVDLSHRGPATHVAASITQLAQPLGHSPQKPLQLGGSVELSWGRPAHLHIASASNRSDSNASGVGRSCVEGWSADR